MIRLVLFLLALAMTGCSAVVTTPEVRLQRLAPVVFDTAGLEVEANLLINNPNRFDLTLLDYSYTLQAAGLPLGTGGNRQTIVFPAQQETGIRIPARIRYSDLLELLKRHADPDRIPYRLTASLQVDTPLGETSIPVDYQGQLSIPENYRPSFILQRFKGLLAPR